MWCRAIVALALTVVVWLGGGCGQSDEERQGAQSDLPDEIIVEFVTEESDSGRLRWKLSAPQAERFNNKKVFLMDRPRIMFYDDAGVLKTTLVSQRGEYSQETHDMLAYGNVVVTSEEGDILETDSLRYVNADNMIVSDSFVKLTRGNDVITGYGLECDNELSSVDIKRDVRARIIGEEGQPDG